MSPPSRPHARVARRLLGGFLIGAALSLAVPAPSAGAAPSAPASVGEEFHDSHIHLTRYAQEGYDLDTDAWRPRNSIIWAHTGDGWIVHPVEHHIAMLETKEAKDKVPKGNYERMFDQGRRNVGAWELAQATSRN